MNVCWVEFDVGAEYRYRKYFNATTRVPRYIPLALIDPASQQIPSRLNKSENIIDARNNASVVRARATGKTKKTHRYLAAKMHTHRATWLTRSRFFVEKNNARRWYVVEFQGNKTRDHFDELVWQDRQRLWVSKFSMKFVMNAVFEKIFDPQFFLFFFTIVDVEGVKTEGEISKLRV